ncbi:MAG: hypothetical protein K2M03_02525 [Muribaculaceae bacterium]|nr:hypothetical protein [Muribaculaceae bacterium]
MEFLVSQNRSTFRLSLVAQNGWEPAQNFFCVGWVQWWSMGCGGLSWVAEFYRRG